MGRTHPRLPSPTSPAIIGVFGMLPAVIVVSVATFLAVAPVAFAQQPPQTLATNSRGTVKVEGNEILTDSKVLDAAAVRVGAPRGLSSGGGGKFSFDVLLPNGTRREIAADHRG